MNFVKPRTSELSTTYNSITYSATYYKAPLSITGVSDGSYTEWLVGTAYAIGDFVKIDALKKVYRSASASNTGNYPALDGSTDWIEWDVLNSYAMVSSDNFIGSKTTGSDGVIELDFSKSDTLAGIDLDFISANLMLIKTDTTNYLGTYDAGATYAIDDSVVYDNKLYISLVGGNIGNTPDISPTEWIENTDLVFFNQTLSGTDYGALSYGEYFYTDAVVKKRIVLTGFEWLPTSVMRIDLSGAFEIGSIVYGLEEQLGCTLIGSALKFEDRSLINIDEISGYRNVIRYGSVRVLDCSIIFDTLDYSVTSQKVDDILSRNILWIPTNDDTFSESITIGYIENFDMPMNNDEKTQTQTTIIGVQR